MPRAVMYAESDGLEWALVPDEVYITSIEARGWGEENPCQVYALLFDDGSAWSFPGVFVEATEPPPWELEGVTPAAWLDGWRCRWREATKNLRQPPQRSAPAGRAEFTNPDWDLI